MNDPLRDREFEAAFLGACLVDTKVFVNSMIAVDDFATVDHQLIYKAIATVHADTGTTDPLLVADQLKKDGDLNRAGGTGVIYELQAPVVETESAPWYAEEIKHLSTKRRIYKIVQAAMVQAQDIGSDAKSVVASLELELQQLQFEQKKFESQTALQLSKMEIAPVKWFIPNMLPSGLTILAGPPKIGKSFFGWNIAIAVASGGIALSSIDIEKPYSVTYLSLEDSDALVQERLDLISPNFKPDNLHITYDLEQTKFDAAGLKAIGAHLDRNGSELLIVDTWKHVAPEVSAKGTSYDIDYQALLPVQKFANQRNMGIILITHTRKAPDLENAFNQIQGSVGVQASCDTLMMLSHDSGSKTLHVSGRRIPSEQYSMTVSEGIWKLEGNAQDYRMSEIQKDIIDFLKDADVHGLSAGDLIDLTGKSDKTVRSALRRMVTKGLIVQPKRYANYFYNDEADTDVQLIGFN